MEFFSTRVPGPDYDKDSKTERSDISFKSQHHYYQVDETIEAKIARLTKEIADVQHEVEDNAKNSQLLGTDRQLENIEDLTIALAKIKTTNDQIKDKRDSLPEKADVLQIKGEPISENKNTPVDERSLEVNSKQISKIADIDNRIAVLEKIIGLDELDTSESAYRPILFSLQETRQRLKLITNSPASLESSANNLKSLIETVEKVRALKLTHANISSNASSQAAQQDNRRTEFLSINNNDVSAVSSDEFDESGKPKDLSQKINELYKKVETVEQLEVILPKVLGRLKSLQHLHTDASTTYSSVKEFDKLAFSIKTDINMWKETISQIQENIEKLEATSSLNRSEIKEWNDNLRQQLRTSK